MAGTVIGQILEQRYAIDWASRTQLDTERISLLVSTNNETYEMVQSLEYILSRQRELGTATDDQEALQEKINALKLAFTSIQISISGEVKSLWDIGTVHNAYREGYKIDNFKIINPEVMRLCVKACSDFCSSFPDLVSYSDEGQPDPLPVSAIAKSFLSNTTFGTIDQLRIELEVAYQGVQVSLTG